MGQFAPPAVPGQVGGLSDATSGGKRLSRSGSKREHRQPVAGHGWAGPGGQYHIFRTFGRTLKWKDVPLR